MSDLPLMRAVVSAELGQVSLGQLPKPQAEEGEVLIKVHASAMNPLDWRLRDTNFFKLRYPFGLGFDIAGEVVAIGNGVQGFKVGDKVYGCPHIAKGAGYSDFAVARADFLALMPTTLSYQQAAAIPVSGIAAYDGLVSETKISPSDVVYIPGGGGGVGHIAIQLAKIAGAKVISSCGKPSSLELLKKLGVDVIIDYTKQNVVEAVLAATNGQGADITYDSTYPKEWVSSVKVTKKGGRLVHLGEPGPKSDPEATKLAAANNINIIWCDLGRYSFPNNRAKVKERCHGALEALAKLADAGKLKPHIAKVIELADVPNVLESFKQGAFSGKVVVSVV